MELPTPPAQGQSGDHSTLTHLLRWDEPGFRSGGGACQKTTLLISIPYLHTSYTLLRRFHAPPGRVTLHTLLLHVLGREESKPFFPASLPPLPLTASMRRAHPERIPTTLPGDPGK